MELLDALQPFVNLGTGPIEIVTGIFARISALVFFLPAMGERTVNPRIRLGAAMAIAVMLTPVVMAHNPVAPTTLSGLAVTMGAEALSGALIGFSIRVVMFVLQMAGSIAAQHTSLAQLFGGTIDDQPEPPIGMVLTMAGLALAVSTGIHFKAFGALAISYDVMPFGSFPGGSEAGAWAADRAAFAFSSALALALPFVVLGFIYNLAIGAANRAMPQLMVAFVGAPAITLAGLVMLVLATPIIFSVWLHLVDGVFAALIGGAR